MSIATHRSGPADLGALVALFAAYRQFHGRHPGASYARHWLRNRLERTRHPVVFAGVLDTRVR